LIALSTQKELERKIKHRLEEGAGLDYISKFAATPGSAMKLGSLGMFVALRILSVWGENGV